MSQRALVCPPEKVLIVAMWLFCSVRQPPPPFFFYPLPFFESVFFPSHVSVWKVQHSFSREPRWLCKCGILCFLSKNTMQWFAPSPASEKVVGTISELLGVYRNCVFHPTVQNTHIMLIGSSKMSVGVKVCAKLRKKTVELSSV